MSQNIIKQSLSISIKQREFLFEGKNVKISPLHLFLLLLLSGLGLHLLHLNRVRLAATHVQLMVAHAQLQDAFVYAQSWGIKHKVLQFGGRNKNKE